LCNVEKVEVWGEKKRERKKNWSEGQCLQLPRWTGGSAQPTGLGRSGGGADDGTGNLASMPWGPPLLVRDAASFD